MLLLLVNKLLLYGFGHVKMVGSEQYASLMILMGWRTISQCFHQLTGLSSKFESDKFRLLWGDGNTDAFIQHFSQHSPMIHSQNADAAKTVRREQRKLHAYSVVFPVQTPPVSSRLSNMWSMPM